VGRDVPRSDCTDIPGRAEPKVLLIKVSENGIDLGGEDAVMAKSGQRLMKASQTRK
jgi:hypothetical protein